MTSTTNKSVIGIKFPYQQITLTQISNQAMYCLIQLVYSYFQPYLHFLLSEFINRTPVKGIRQSTQYKTTIQQKANNQLGVNLIKQIVYEKTSARLHQHSAQKS